MIDPVSMSVMARYGLTNCAPNGLAIKPAHQLLAGCRNRHRSVIIDRTNGTVLAKLSTVGGSDEVWFNPGDNPSFEGDSALQSLGVSTRPH